MDKKAVVSEFVADVRRARAEWDALVDRINRAEMSTPGFCGTWSLKDVIAHLTWYEREMVGMLKARAFVGSSYWELPLDGRNALIFEESQDVTWTLCWTSRGRSLRKC